MSDAAVAATGGPWASASAWAAVAEVVEPGQRAPADHVGRSDRFRLLIADDSEAIRALAGALISLEPELLLVGEAADGAEAVALAEAVKADALVLDIAMPMLDGLEVIERLRSSRPRLQILVYPGLHQQGRAVAASREKSQARAADGARSA